MASMAQRRWMRRIELTSNEYWGRRSGMLTRTGERIFKLRRGAQAHQEHQGPSGWKLKKKGRQYRNAKLVRKGISLVFQGRKGVKQLAA